MGCLFFFALLIKRTTICSLITIGFFLVLVYNVFGKNGSLKNERLTGERVNINEEK